MKKFKAPLKVVVPVAIALLSVAFIVIYTSTQSVPMLQPAGSIARQERNLIYFGLLLAIIVVVPTFGLAIFIAVKYREGNKKPKKYQPDWDHSRLYETIWWGVPIMIIGVLCVVTWNSAHHLDPYKKLASDKPALHVEVVGLDWKWLFIYPDQNVASVNQLALPTDRPIAFRLTSDTIMNSFWVPALSGQIYLMPGMITQLHLTADKAGDYYGSPANIAGKGFARMTFNVKAMGQKDFDSWVAKAKANSRPMDDPAYTALYKPSIDVPVSYYSSVQNGLFDDIVNKYMAGMSMPMQHSDTGYPQLEQSGSTSKPDKQPHDMSNMKMDGMDMDNMKMEMAQ